MAEERVQRRLAAILAADIVGYSRMMEADESGTIVRLKALRAEFLHPKVAEYGGRIVKTTGDGTLVEFPSAVDAVNHAIVVQHEMARRNVEVAEEARIELRMGINVGDIVIDGDDILGDGVNIAARLEGLADPGAICVSGAVHDQIAGKIDAEFKDLGPHTVKNISRPVQVYRVRGVAEALARATSGEPLAVPERPSIAVLPFQNMSGDPEQEYFADGLAEDIITSLSRFRWFFVIARNSSFSYRGTSPDVGQVAKELGVQYVLEGSVRKGGNRVRITAQLIDALTGRHVWAERYDRDLEDIFVVQDEISNAITTTVAPAFVAAELQRTERKAPENFDAWDHVLRGNWYLWRGKDGIPEARRMFETALELDPKSTMALSGLATALTNIVMFGMADDVEETRAMAYRAARRAVDFNENDASAHAALALVNFFMGQIDAASASCRRALELNPNLAVAQEFHAIGLSWRGEDEDALQHAENATRLDPRGTDFMGSFAHACAAFGAGRYEQSSEWARKATEVTPEFPGSWRYLAASLANLGRLEEARAAKGQLLRVMPNDSIAHVRATLPSIRPERLERLIDGLRKAGLPE